MEVVRGHRSRCQAQKGSAVRITRLYGVADNSLPNGWVGLITCNLQPPRKKKLYWCKLCGEYRSVAKLAICKHCQGDTKLLNKMVKWEDE